MLQLMRVPKPMVEAAHLAQVHCAKPCEKRTVYLVRRGSTS